MRRAVDRAARRASENAVDRAPASMRSTSDTSAAKARLKPGGIRSGAGRSRLTARLDGFGRQRPDAGPRQHADAVKRVRVVAIGPQLPHGGDETAAPEHVGRMQIGARKPFVAADTRQHHRGSRRSAMRGSQSSSLTPRVPGDRVFEAPAPCPDDAASVARSNGDRHERNARSAVAVAPGARLLVGIRIVRERVVIRADLARGLRRGLTRDAIADDRRRIDAAAQQHGDSIEAAQPRRHRPLSQLAQVLRVLARRRRTAARGADRCPSAGPDDSGRRRRCRRHHVRGRHALDAAEDRFRGMRHDAASGVRRKIPCSGAASTPFTRSNWRGSVANATPPSTTA